MRFEEVMGIAVIHFEFTETNRAVVSFSLIQENIEFIKAVQKGKLQACIDNVQEYCNKKLSFKKKVGKKIQHILIAIILSIR